MEGKLTSSQNESFTLYQKGLLSDATKVAEKALKVAEEIFEPDHPNVATSIDGLALLYYSQGKYSKAEHLYKRAFAIREKVLGKDHPDMAQSLNNLAELYRTQGKYTEAEPLYKRALRIYEKVKNYTEKSSSHFYLLPCFCYFIYCRIYCWNS